MTTEASESEQSSPGLHLSFRSEDPSKVEKNQLQDDVSTVFIPQESGKKSSYRLASPIDASSNVAECFVVHKPAHLVIEYRGNKNATGNNKHPFFLGGFQITSNSRQVEVYLSNKEGRESYLMTSRGIPLGDSTAADGVEYMHKAVSVVPGGPRAITQLHIKLLSLRPNDETFAKIHSIKVTARLPEVAPSPGDRSAEMAKSTPIASNKVPTPASGPSTVNESTTTSNTGNRPSSIPVNPFAAQKSVTVPSSAGLPDGILTQSDMGAALAGIHAMARSTEERLEKSVEIQLSRLDQNLAKQSNERWERIEKHMMTLTGVVVSQKRVMEQQNQLVVKQQQMIMEQSQLLNTLQDQQSMILSSMKTLQGDVQTSRKQQEGQQGDIQEQLQEQQQSILDAMKVLGEIGQAKDRQQHLQQQQLQQEHQQALENAFVYAMQNGEIEGDIHERFYAAAAAGLEEEDDDEEDKYRDSAMGLGSKPMLSPIAEVNSGSFDTAETLEDQDGEGELDSSSNRPPQSRETLGDMLGDEKLEMELEMMELGEEDQAKPADEFSKTLAGGDSPTTTKVTEDASTSTVSGGVNPKQTEEKSPPTTSELRDLIMLDVNDQETNNNKLDLAEANSQQGHLSPIGKEEAKQRTENIANTQKAISDEGDIPMVTESKNHPKKVLPVSFDPITLPDDVERKTLRVTTRDCESEEKKETQSPPRSVEENVPTMQKQSNGEFGIDTVPSDECTPRGAFNQDLGAIEIQLESDLDPCCFVFDGLGESMEQVAFGNRNSPTGNGDDSSTPEKLPQVPSATASEPSSKVPAADANFLGLEMEIP